jgi:mannose-6-phosphate isomerase-like protein (cupin superfamily)
VLIDVLTEPGAPVTMAEAILPEGASPPAHVHADLDDSFYILDGRMIIRCGDDVWQAGPGSWVLTSHGFVIHATKKQVSVIQGEARGTAHLG